MELRGLREHARRVFQRGWTVVVSGIGGALGLVSLATTPAKGPFVPTWLWISLLVGGILIGQFLAFRDVRKERDEARADSRRRFDVVRYRFQLDSLAGGPTTAKLEGKEEPETGYHFHLIFVNGGTEVLEYYVERLRITVGNHTSTEEQFGSNGGIILPGRAGSFFAHWIPAPVGDPVAGRGEYVIRYGHPSGGPRFRTRHAFNIAWQSAPGQLTPTWITVGEITHDVVESEGSP
jgi:hypothetical protein